MGKTTFIEMWKKYLDNKGIPNLYFSAWEDDYSNEPLIAIFGEIQNYIKKNEDIEKKVEKGLGEVVKKIAKIGVKGSWELAKGYMQQKFGAGYEEVIKIACDEFEKSVKNYPKEKSLLEEIKKGIKQIFQEITNKKFVIFIDELDRCRPLYAIELLERVKHLFGTSGVIFILSIDKEQLGESIKSQYGNIDANQYLRRFFDLEYHLSAIHKNKYQKFLYEDLKLNCQYDEINLALIGLISNYKKLTLRELKQFFDQIKILIPINKDLYENSFAVQVIITLVLIEVEKLNRDEYGRVSFDLRNEFRRYAQGINSDTINYLGKQLDLIFRQVDLIRNNSNDCLENEKGYFGVVSEIYQGVQFLENFTK